jgi:osmotically-inducible protein OsmY
MDETNARMEEDVRGELSLDPRLEGSEVRVEVRDRVVTLTGTATSGTQRRAAEEAARRVVGVLYVANDLAVKAASL